MFVSGGISGFFLAQPSIDTYLHGTYFVVGHFHFVMGVAAMFGIFAGTYFWFPKMYGRMMNETLGKVHFFLTLIGVYCIFMPMHYLGLAGNVRRYSAFTDEYMKGVAPPAPVHHHRGAVHRGSAADLFYNLIRSRFRGAPGPGQSLAGHLAGVVGAVPTAVRQLRRPASGGIPRPQRVRCLGSERRLHHAGLGRIPAAGRDLSTLAMRRPLSAGPHRRVGRHRGDHHVVRRLHQRHGGATGSRSGLAAYPAAP